MKPNALHSPRAVRLAILVAALGYFVDIYDLVLFSIVRNKSLLGIGIPKTELLEKGVMLLNAQMGGMLLGGIVWGILGDKRGRISVLFGSIVMYSIANIANGFVTNVEQYAVLRFIAGVGLAGELGAGITLVSEMMDKNTRGVGTTVIATIGVAGAVLAAVIGDIVSWRTAYFIGGGLGLALLLLRVGVTESGMFEQVKKQSGSRGNFLSLFSSTQRLAKYLRVILIGVPIWYTIGILITFCPEFGQAMGMQTVPSPIRAVMFTYIGLIVGDFASGALSQVLRSRKKAILIFLAMTASFVALYFTLGRLSLTGFYAICGMLGFSTGYWAVFVTTASEQFGTNIRATVTTTAPNFVRGAVVVLTHLFTSLKAPLGIEKSGIVVGVITLFVAFISLAGLEETYGKDLDYVEP